MSGSEPHSWLAARLGAIAATYAGTGALQLHGAELPVGSLVASAVLALALVLLTQFDIAAYRLPNTLTLPLAAVGCAVAGPMDPHAIAWRVLSAAAGFGAFALVAEAYRRLRGREGLGRGDAKLLGAGGAWVGLDQLPVVVLIASLLALAGATVLAVAGRKIGFATRLPFGPFLAIAIWLSWLDGLRLL